MDTARKSMLDSLNCDGVANRNHVKFANFVFKE